jgi:hypothetical protein
MLFRSDSLREAEAASRLSRSFVRRSRLSSCVLRLTGSRTTSLFFVTPAIGTAASCRPSAIVSAPSVACVGSKCLYFSFILANAASSFARRSARASFFTRRPKSSNPSSSISTVVADMRFCRSLKPRPAPSRFSPSTCGTPAGGKSGFYKAYEGDN